MMDLIVRNQIITAPMKTILKLFFPDRTWRWMRNHRPLRFGSFRRMTPISRGYGMERGTPIDRYYIERFLQQSAADVCGCVLEFGDNRYTKQFGGDRVARAVVWNGDAGGATVTGDLASAEHVKSNQFDCIICTQVLLCIFDLPGAVRNLHRLLKPGGSLLISLPGIAQIARHDMNQWGDYWRFTTLSAQRLLENHFPRQSIEIESHGNVLTSMAFLHGVAQEELEKRELEYDDPDYQFVITVRAVKSVTAEPPMIETSSWSLTDATRVARGSAGAQEARAFNGKHPLRGGQAWSNH